LLMFLLLRLSCIAGKWRSCWYRICSYYWTIDYRIHGLYNYRDTKTNCRLYWCLILEFIDWRYS
jgi:hypothetical protein